MRSAELATFHLDKEPVNILLKLNITGTLGAFFELENEPLTVVGRLHAFIEARSRHSDTRAINIFNSSLRAWLRYYDFLKIIRSRYEQMNTVYIESHQLEMKRIKAAIAAGEAPSRHLTPEEVAQMQRSGEIAQMLHLDIESFYVFADILLDRISSTFRYYFWRKPEWKHWQLALHIATICRRKPLAAVPADILTLPADLQRHVVSYRNNYIAHVEDPRLQFATTWDLDKMTKIFLVRLYPENEETTSIEYPSSGINEAAALIDRYIVAMLDFLDANAEQSILPLGGAANQQSS